MALPVDVRDLAARILARLDEARNFYLHTQQAWQVVQQIAHENRSVGIVDAATGQEVLAHDLEPMAQRYVTVHLAESAFKGLSGLLKDWILAWPGSGWRSTPSNWSRPITRSWPSCAVPRDAMGKWWGGGPQSHHPRSGLDRSGCRCFLDSISERTW